MAIERDDSSTRFAPILTFDESDDIRVPDGNQSSAKISKTFLFARLARLLLSHLGFLLLVILYLCFGGWLFSRIESKYENEYNAQRRIRYSQSLDEIRRIVHDEFNWKLNRSFELHYALWRGMLSRLDSSREKFWYVHVPTDRFERLIGRALARLHDEEARFVDKQDADVPWSSSRKWTLSSATLFSATLITTVGYGNIAPASIEGKLFTCLYAMFGIPIMIIYLNNSGDLFAFVVIKYYALIVGKFRPRKNQRKIVRVPIVVTLPILLLYIAAGACLFSHWEGWTYIDGAYFSFITFTTIGLGDLVPGKGILTENKHGKTILCVLYLFIGLILTAMCLKLMQDDIIAWKERLLHRFHVSREKKHRFIFFF